MSAVILPRIKVFDLECWVLSRLGILDTLGRTLSPWFGVEPCSTRAIKEAIVAQVAPSDGEYYNLVSYAYTDNTRIKRLRLLYNDGITPRLWFLSEHSC